VLALAVVAVAARIIQKVARGEALGGGAFGAGNYAVFHWA